MAGEPHPGPLDRPAPLGDGAAVDRLVPAPRPRLSPLHLRTGRGPAGRRRPRGRPSDPARVDDLPVSRARELRGILELLPLQAAARAGRLVGRHRHRLPPAVRLRRALRLRLASRRTTAARSPRRPRSRRPPAAPPWRTPGSTACPAAPRSWSGARPGRVSSPTSIEPIRPGAVPTAPRRLLPAPSPRVAADRRPRRRVAVRSVDPRRASLERALEAGILGQGPSLTPRTASTSNGSADTSRPPRSTDTPGRFARRPRIRGEAS